ncbi:MAG: ATP-binding protein, partial [Burkholderiaceae bacterium]|nr:ATP-binding protein [Burkholderiaceae bacterium]
LRLVVRDSGVGIAPDVISRIFGLFERGAAVPSGATGLGIGLALVHQIARLHGGRVSARSDGHGQGSEFTAVIPAVPIAVRESEPNSVADSVDVAERPRAHALHERHTRTTTA